MYAGEYSFRRHTNMQMTGETLVFVGVIAAAVAAGYGIRVNTGVTAG